MTRVTVLLPVYNAQTTIGRSIRSILEQSMSDLEVIVVDDGSTDQSAQIIADTGDRRVILVRKNHRGVSSAANTALKHASSEYIARMDADDVAEPERLERQLALIQQQNLDVVGCQIRITKRSGESVPSMSRYEQWINQETPQHEDIVGLRFVEFPLVNPTILARRKYFELQFAENGFPEDYELMLRAASAGMQFGKVPLPLLTWTDGAQRLTRNDSRYSSKAFMACRRHYFRRDVLQHAQTVDLWGSGQTGKQWFHWLQNEGISIRRIVEVHPRKVGTRLNSVPVIHCEDMPNSDGTPMISAVGAMGAREMIRIHAEQRGYRSGQDLWFVA